MSSVLVLNATYEPLNIVSVRRAIVLLLKEKAEVLEATEDYIRSQYLTLPVPSVIRLVYYVRVPRRMGIPLSRRTVLMRDGYTCQYCGAQPPRSALTIDHVIPKMRGGETVWSNVVCACKACNQRKGSRTPAEAYMQLQNRPGRPKYVAFVLVSQAATYECWRKYVPGLCLEPADA